MFLSMTEELAWMDVPAEKKFFKFLVTEAKKVLGAETYKIFLDDRRHTTVNY